MKRPLKIKRIPLQVLTHEAWKIILLLLSLLTTVLLAEDADMVTSDSESSSSSSSSSMSSSSSSSSSHAASTQLGPEEAAVIMFFCIFFAVCVSLTAIGLAYFSYLEDGMMRTFQKQGHALHSTVISAEFSRAAESPSSSCGAAAADEQQQQQENCYACGALAASSSETSCTASNTLVAAHNNHSSLLVAKGEYNVVIEYKVGNADGGYKSKVRKQVKALGSDFTKPIPPCIQVQMIAFPKDESNNMDISSVALAFARSSGSSSSSSIGNGGNGEHHHHEHHRHHHQLKQHHQCSAITSHLIPILVLDDHPKSAIPQGHVQRACSWRYQLPTITFVLCMLAFAGFCLLLAADVMYPANLLRIHNDRSADGELLSPTTLGRGHVFMIVGGVLFGLVVLEALVIHYFFGTTLYHSIQETYLEGDDQGSMCLDETTLSSGDDTYLMV